MLLFEQVEMVEADIALSPATNNRHAGYYTGLVEPALVSREWSEKMLAKTSINGEYRPMPRAIERV